MRETRRLRVGFSRLTARRRARDSFERSRRYDYSGKDFTGTGEYFTKGSLKRANFNGANLTGISLFGADLTGATFVDANLSNANLGQANLTGADFTGAVLSGAIVSSAQLDDVKIDNSDWSDVIVRKDVLTGLCKVANGKIRRREIPRRSLCSVRERRRGRGRREFR